MNIIWSILLLLSILMILLKGDADFLTTAINSIESTLKLCFNLGVIYIFWCGILQVVEDCKIGSLIAKLLKPFLKKAFPNLSPYAHEQIALNLSTNMLGISNASLPAGLNALKEINKSKTIQKNKNTNLLIILNCISLQIIPTTVLSLYTSAGGQDFIVLWICGLIISAICITIAILLSKRF